MAFRSLNVESVARFNSADSSMLLDNITDRISNSIKLSNSTKSSQTFAPSALRCERRSWFRLRGVDPDLINITDNGLEWTAMLGTAIHEYIQSLLIDNNLLTDEYIQWYDPIEYMENVVVPYEDSLVRYTAQRSGNEVRFQFVDPPIRFSCDGILNVDGRFNLLEIKTCDHSTFVDLTDPKSEHIDQFIAYCTLLHLDGGFFLYVDRQYGDMKCYQYKVSYADKQNMLDMFKRVQEYVQFGLSPEGLPKGDKWCTPSYCPYYKRCQEYRR